MTDTLTLFAAIKPPNHIIKAVTAVQKNVDGVRWAVPENLHITLGYFGRVSTEYTKTLDHELACGAGGGFKLSLQGADVFGSSKPHTLWLGVSPTPPLMALNKHIHNAARRAHVKMETRKYVPHISLAYVRDGVHLADLSRFIRKNINFKSKPFIVDQFALYSSRPQKKGSNIYKKEANYPLLGR